MRRFLSILILALSALVARASSDLDALLRLLEHRKVSFAFTCVLKTDVPVNYEGTVLAQGACFVMKANGVESYCDGNSVALVDRKTKEVYVEDATGLEEFLKANFASVTDLVLKDVQTSDVADEDISTFRFDLSKLDSTWIVTDLR